MAKAVHVKSAQKNIYHQGKMIEYVSKKGKKAGQTKSKRDRTVPNDENDPIFIAKGESYYWWAFQYGGKHYSKTAPKRSQLTQSEFLIQLYDLEDRVEIFTASDKDDFESQRDELVQDINTLKEECEEKLSNMPDQLQTAPTGEMIQERIDGLDSWASDLEGIECDYEGEELREEVNEEKDEDEELSEEEIEEKVKEKIQEKVDEAIEELQGTSANL
jgi:hypothetical protein